MAPFDRPVRADEIGRRPEMALRYPAEHRRFVGTTADEGAGTGFDNAHPFAYFELWFDTTDQPADVERWYRKQLVLLGWNEDEPASSPTVDPRVRHVVWSRSDDETISLTWFGENPPLGRARPSHRLSYTVAGTWLDGSAEPRPA